MKVLFAYEYTFRFYSEVLAEAIADHRPHLDVRPTGTEHLTRELVLFDPDAVISSQPNGVDSSNNRTVWVELPAEPSSPADICLDGDHVKVDSLPLMELISILDEAEALRQEDPPAESC
jgi:hypothetical protein